MSAPLLEWKKRRSSGCEAIPKASIVLPDASNEIKDGPCRPF
jgi:hypothetical protein